MNNVVNFSQLKRKEVRCLIYTDEKGEIKVERDSDIIDKIKENNIIEGFIEIYNPTGRQKEDIINTMRNDVDDKGQVTVTGVSIIKNFLDMLTNIKLDMEDDELMEEIIKDPSEILLVVQDEIGKIIKEVGTRFVKNASVLQDLSENELKKVLSNYQEEQTNNKLTEEELKAIEKAKGLGII